MIKLASNLYNNKDVKILFVNTEDSLMFLNEQFAKTLNFHKKSKLTIESESLNIQKIQELISNYDAIFIDDYKLLKTVNNLSLFIKRLKELTINKDILIYLTIQKRREFNKLVN